MSRIDEYRKALSASKIESPIVCSGCRCGHCSSCRSCDHSCKSNRAADGESESTFNLQLSLTSLCTRRCKHCYQDEYMADMPLELCRKVIHSFRALCEAEKVVGEITLTGGDPFVAPKQLWVSIATAEEAGFDRLNIMTNGDLMTEGMASRLRQRPIVKAVQVSIDGLQDTHDSIRGHGSFARATDAIRHLSAVGYPVLVMMTVSRRNLADVISVHELIHGLGGRTMGLDRFSPQGSGSKDVELVVSTEEWSVACRSVLEWRDAHGWDHVGLIRPLWHQYADCTGGMCSVGLSGLAVLPNGDVLLCRRLPLVIGSARTHSLLDIWRSPILDKWRDPQAIPGCNSCGDHGRCRGCRAMAYALTGDPFARDPHCTM